MRDGEDTPQPFNLLQQRIGRKTLSKKILAELPVQLLAYDLLELGGADLREQPLSFRREKLEVLCVVNHWPLSPRGALHRLHVCGVESSAALSRRSAIRSGRDQGR